MPTLWPFVPLPDITETLEFATDIRTTPEDEQRDSLHEGVRLLTYRHTCAEDIAWGEALMRGNATGQWYVPIWTEASKAGAVLSTDTVLAVDAAATYTDKALIFAGLDAYVLADIASVGSGTITLAAAVGQAFANPTVAPIATAIAPSGLAMTKRAATIHAVEIAFRCVEAEAIAATALPQYLGLDFSACAGAAVEPLQATVIQPVEMFDSGFGAVAVESLRDVLEGRWGMTLVETGAAGRKALRAWLYFLRGRDRAFWAPQWAGKLTLAAAASAGNTSILVAPRVPDPAIYVGQHVFLGGPQFRAITAAVVDGGNHRLSLAALSATPTAARLVRRVRLDSDRIEVQHRRAFFARLTTTIAEVAA